MLTRRLALAALSLALAACVSGGAPRLDATQSAMQARHLFGSEAVASGGRPEVIGFYSNGCVAGAQELPETGPTWQAMRLSRNRNWAHPETIDFVQDLSREVARTTSWNGLYVGDMSQPRGGPMLTGHVSHQSGLDVDIWMLPARDLTLSRQDRENLSSISVRSQRGAWINENWTAEHATVLRAAATDPRVARIFVTTGVKVWLCRNTPEGDRDWLSRIRPATGHHYHFHVRLTCPAGSRNCEEQEPVPAGDGCAAAEARAARILNPAPPSSEPPAPAGPAAPQPPRGNGVTLSQVPGQCLSLLSSL
ncbi:penicillin-insensitive murein endopeptidase [Maritalea mobilis]|uniref:penicillin-insensitive murein endopeptidase n=1 Tax=Maritalea mobilis TaxID=483324 RepID=UPI001C94CB82|nr:penicillin-insensitive murein endopeptidase [Maritalea mobilis]MBY6202892.1 penicillin-insensitive murein endopeptidase [Maritalea mobilis]